MQDSRGDVVVLGGWGLGARGRSWRLLKYTFFWQGTRFRFRRARTHAGGALRPDEVRVTELPNV